jgi:hypothetical protein
LILAQLTVENAVLVSAKRPGHFGDAGLITHSASSLILKDKISELLVGTQGLAQAVDKIASEDEVFFSERFVLPRGRC